MTADLAHIKFLLPQPRPDLLRRPRLLDFLHSHIHRKLIMISAAAGYGKTTLLTNFVHDTDYPVAWLHLDEADSDPALLLTNIVTALRRAFPAFVSTAPELAAQPGVHPEQLAAALNHEITEAISDYFILALDDFHLLGEAESVIRFFNSLLADLPEQAHLLLAGRSLPPLDFTALATRSEVEGLSEEDLRFTAVEVQALIELLHYRQLSNTEAEALVSDNEGWVTGILLTSQLERDGPGGTFARSALGHRPFYDFMAAEVLRRQPDDLQQFLLESAVLPEMAPPVCDTVLGRADSAACLRQAERHRLFISAVGDEFPTYHYHHLFRDFLLTQLRDRHPARLQALQLRAAEWHAAHDLLEAAVTFFCLAGDLPRAAELVEANVTRLYVAGRFATLRYWAEQLAALTPPSPALYLNLAKLEIDSGGLDKAEEYLALAAAGFAARAEISAGSVETTLQRSMLLYRRGEFTAALVLAQAGLAQTQDKDWPIMEAMAWRYQGQCQFALHRLVEADDSYRRATTLLLGPQAYYDRATVLSDWALVLKVMGQTARASEIQREALALWRELSNPGSLAGLLNNIGCDLYLLGDYESALANFREAFDWAHRGGSLRIEATLLVSQADVFADLGDFDQAADLYRQALARSEQRGDWNLAVYLHRALARLDRWSGNFVAALERLRRAEQVAGSTQSVARLSNVESLRGITLVEMGRVAEGREILEGVCAELEQSGALADLSQSLLFRARAEFGLDETTQAERSLTRALEIAEQLGYDQMLLNEVRSTRDLLEACRSRPDIGPRVAGLLARADSFGATLIKLKNFDTRLASVAPSISEKALTICALGRSRVFKDGAEIPPTVWGDSARRPPEMLFFLVERAPVQRAEVLQTFWPDKPQARASANLRQIAYRVRRATGHDWWETDEEAIRLKPGLSLDYDVRRFERQARAALGLLYGDLRRVGALASTIALYTGDYLADLTVEWARDRRRELSELHINARLAYADELLGLLRYAEARDTLLPAIEADHYRSDLCERMLNALAGLGRRHEVSDHYRRYCDLLQRDLGLDPPPELRALYARLIQ